MEKKTISILLIISGFHALLSFGTNIFLAKNLGVEVLGKYNYAVTLGTIAFQYVIFGMDQILVNEYVHSGKQVIAKLYCMKIFNYLVLLVISISIYIIFDKTIGLLTCAIAISALNLQLVYEIKNEQKKYSYIFFAEKLVYGILLFLYISKGGENLINIFIIYFFTAFISILYQHQNCRNEFEWHGIQLIDKKIFYSGISILITSLSKYTFGGFSRILIKENLGFTALGVFTLLWQFISLVSIYTQQIISVVRLRITKIIIFAEFEENRKISILLLIASIAPTIGITILMQFLTNMEYFNSLFIGIENLIPLVGIYMVVGALDSFIPLYYIPLKLEVTALKAYISLSLICILLMSANILPDNLYSYMLVITGTHFIAILIISLAVLKKLNTKIWRN